MSEILNWLDVPANRIATPLGMAELKPQETLYLLSLQTYPEGVTSTDMAAHIRRLRANSPSRDILKTVASNLVRSIGKEGRREIIENLLLKRRQKQENGRQQAVHMLSNPESTALILTPYRLIDRGSYYLPDYVPAVTPEWKIIDLGTDTIATPKGEFTVTPVAGRLSIPLFNNSGTEFNIAQLVTQMNELLGTTFDITGSYDDFRELAKLVPEIKVEGKAKRRISIESGQKVTFAIHKPGYPHIHD